MISTTDFAKKQILFIFFSQGEKLSFSNDNLVVRNADGTIKFQCTCYRIFLVYAIGIGSITSGLIQRSKRFGFSIVMLTPTFRPYQIVGFNLEGNTLLHRIQYNYSSLDLAKHITANKIRNQRYLLMSLRNKPQELKDAIAKMDEYISKLPSAENLHELMGYEGIASHVFFNYYFIGFPWKRREPRTKCDMANTVLDIGYTLLFSFIESLLVSFGFDLYCGIMHTDFYMRKSLVCDLVEPFRCLIDARVTKAIHLNQCKEEDFLIDNGRYMLLWKKSPQYVSWLMEPLIEHKEEIHLYIQSYYRAFMKHKPAEEFPVFDLGGKK